MTFRTLLVSAVAAGAGAIAASTPAEALISVNCGTPPGINDALALDNEIIVNGTCVEDVAVRIDDASISGGAGGGAISGTVSAIGAQRFSMRDMTITVPGIAFEGILVMDGASANIANVQVSGSLECGILVFMNSFANVRDSVFDDNGWGMCASTGSVLRGINNTVTNTLNEGVLIDQHGTYRAQNDTIDNSAGGPVAVGIRRNSFADLRPALVTGRVNATDQSHLRVRLSSSVTGDVLVDFLSEIDVSGGSSITGNVTVSNLSVGKATADTVLVGQVTCTDSVCLRAAASPATAGRE